MTPDQLMAYKSKWDPSVYLPGCEIPALFYIGSNDGAFPLDIWQKSALLARGRRMLCIPVTAEHGHIWNQKEIFAFADAVTGKGRPLPDIGKAVIADGYASAGISGAGDLQNSLLVMLFENSHFNIFTISALRPAGLTSSFITLPPFNSHSTMVLLGA
jgi:hypothetical protein